MRFLEKLKHIVRSWSWFDNPLNKCQACDESFSGCDSHITQLGNAMGIAVLCEACWERYTVPDRLRFYKARWIAMESQVPWEVVRAAVLHERIPCHVQSVEHAQYLIQTEPDVWFAYVTCDDGIMVVPRIAPQILESWYEA